MNEEAARILASVLHEVLPPGEPAFDVVQEDVFRLTVGSQSFLIKWIADQNVFGQNELRISHLFESRAVIPAPRLAFEKRVEGGTIAGWEWVGGRDLREFGRGRLVEAFALLGELHRGLAYQGEIVSPLNNRSYATVHEMLAEEVHRLCAPFNEATQAKIASILARLEGGFPTLIHGDMHPGNVIANNGRIWFVDWSYACYSLNLLDLDYIQSIPLRHDSPAWTVIRPEEAAAVLPAYFKAAGLEHLDIYKTHHAVMIWNLLRTYENSLRNGYRAEAGKIREQIFDLL